MRILFVSDYLPYPLITGDRIRIYNLIRRAADRHDVSMIGYLQHIAEAEGVTHMMQFCSNVEILEMPHRRKLARVPNLIQFLTAGTPIDFEFLYSSELAARICELASSTDFDIIQFEHSRMAKYIEALPHEDKSKRILVLHNVASHQYASISRIQRTVKDRLRSSLHSRMLARWEPRYAEQFDRCVTVSENDRRQLMAANPRLNVDVIPNGVDCQRYQPLAFEAMKPTVLVMGSMSYPPNADGAKWFFREILPHIRRALEDVEVWIVGISPPPELTALDSERVHVTGRVDDVRPYYARSHVSVVPLRAGSGTRLKILEAMALGRPVISTSIGCEGLDVIPGEHLLVADDPLAFAEGTVRLLTDPELRLRIAANARRLVEMSYDWNTLAQKMLRLYGDVLAEG